MRVLLGIVRWEQLQLTTLRYCIYVSSFLCYDHTGNVPYVVFAGAFLGVSAGMLWTAQGAIVMAYPLEQQKGKYIAIFWAIFNFGAGESDVDRQTEWLETPLSRH